MPEPTMKCGKCDRPLLEIISPNGVRELFCPVCNEDKLEFDVIEVKK